MKICVFGDSHVGMLRAAVQERADPNVHYTWFARGRSGIEGAVLEGTTLIAKDPELQAHLAQFDMPQQVDVAAFDALIFVGRTLSVFHAVELLKRHRVSSWVWPDGTFLGPRARKRPQLLSEPAFVAAMAALIKQHATYRLLCQLADCCDVPRFVLPAPAPSARILNTGYLTIDRIHKAGRGDDLTRTLHAAHQTVFSSLATLILQPEETLEHGFLTQEQFTREAVRIDGASTQPDSDMIHASGAYGQLCLNKILAALG